MKHRITGGREIEILVTWIILLKLQQTLRRLYYSLFNYIFCQMYKELRSQTFVFFPISVLPLKTPCIIFHCIVCLTLLPLDLCSHSDASF